MARPSLRPSRSGGRAASVTGFSCVLALILGDALVAQDYRDFTVVRNRQQPYQSLLQLRVGFSGTEAEGQDDLTNGHASDDTIDGFLYYHSKELLGRDYALDLYAGLDGAYVGIKSLMRGRESQTRLEAFTRHTVFYRPGFYDRGRFLRVGNYEGSDYGLRLGTAQNVDQGLLLDFGLFYKSYEFEAGEQNTTDYIIPDDHTGYGIDVSLEQNTLTMDRVLGIPREGLLWTVKLEYERNDSEKQFGWTVPGTEELAKGFYRAETRLEGYIPNGRTSAWVIYIDGGYYDPSDMIRAAEAQHVQGHIWGDGSLGYRMALGDSFILKPFFQLQYSKRMDRSGISSREKVFWGAGMQGSLLLYDKNVALVFDYSYVDNPARAHIGIDQDLYGEHIFFVGLDISFGSGYRSR